MEQDFKQAAKVVNPQAKVITSDWQGTLSVSSIGYNIPLFELLRDAHLAGHQVIFTSLSAAADIKTNLVDAIDLISFSDFDLSALTSARILSKSELARETHNGLKVDIAFDDVSILKQQFEVGGELVPYATPRLEVTITKQGDAYPLSYIQLREMCGLETQPPHLAQGLGRAP